MGGVPFVAGKAGRKAFSFDGASQYVVVKDDPELNPARGLTTVAAWINPEAQPDSVAPPIIKKAGDGTAPTEAAQATGSTPWKCGNCRRGDFCGLPGGARRELGFLRQPCRCRGANGRRSPGFMTARIFPFGV